MAKLGCHNVAQNLGGQICPRKKSVPESRFWQRNTPFARYDCYLILTHLTKYLHFDEEGGILTK